MNTEKLMNTIEIRIEDAKRYTLSTAEYSESIYRGNIAKLNEANGMLFVLSLDFAPVNFQEYRETIEGLILDLERKIERVKRYNGWSNYETWNAALWIDNDYGLYTMVTEFANEECGDQAAMAKYLENLATEDMPDLNGMYGDILRANMNEIDWFEVAEHFRPDDGWMEERESDPDEDPEEIED